MTVRARAPGGSGNSDGQTALLFALNPAGRINENWSEEGLKAFVLINIDEFKMVNDLFGHNVGDSILKTIAKIVINELGNGAIVGRLGGDEFVGLVTRLSDREELEKRLSALNENTRYEKDIIFYLFIRWYT